MFPVSGAVVAMAYTVVRPWRHADAEVDQEFVGNPFLAPSPIRGRHRGDQLLQVHGNRRPAACPRLPAPPQPESLSMPPNEGLRFHNGQQMAPVDEARQGDERDPCGVIGAARLHLPFPVQRQLLPQEQVFGGKSGT